MKTISTLLLFVFLVGMAIPGRAEDCDKIAAMKKYYGEMKYIYIEFSQRTYSDVFETVDMVAGTLTAGTEGKFRLTMKDQNKIFQEMVCNGTLYWSYSVENRQALVDSVAKLGDWNPLTLIYDPESVYECRSQKLTGDTLTFEMAALDSTVSPREFTLNCDIEYNPHRINYVDDNHSRIEIIITGFKRTDDISENTFEFAPPAGVEVIQMP